MTKKNMTTPSVTEFVKNMQALKRRRDVVLGSAEKARKANALRQQFIPIHRFNEGAKTGHLGAK